MRNSWRLVTDLTLFLQGTTEMWIIPSDSRIAKNNVKKELAGQQFKEVEFENEEFTCWTSDNYVFKFKIK